MLKPDYSFKELEQPAVALNQLLAVAIGDAYGFQFENREDNFSALNTGESYSQHPTFPEQVPGNYSDDTQMTVAVYSVLAESMFTYGRQAYMPHVDQFDRSFLQTWQRDPRAGYSRGMLTALQTAWREGKSLSEVCESKGKSEKSGAAMRATPFGRFPEKTFMRQLTRMQGAITHKGSALLAAEGVALAAHYLLFRVGPREDLLHFLAREMQDDIWATPWQGKVGSSGMDSARAAVTAIAQANSLTDLLIRCCAWTGDVDTVAAIAMGCAFTSLKNDLRPSLLEGMENGPYGRDYIFRTGNTSASTKRRKKFI